MRICHICRCVSASYVHMNASIRNILCTWTHIDKDSSIVLGTSRLPSLLAFLSLVSSSSYRQSLAPSLPSPPSFFSPVSSSSHLHSSAPSLSFFPPPFPSFPPFFLLFHSVEYAMQQNDVHSLVEVKRIFFPHSRCFIYLFLCVCRVCVCSIMKSRFSVRC